MPDIDIIREGQEPIIISGIYDDFTFDEKALNEALDKAKDTIEHVAQVMQRSVWQIREALESVVRNQKWPGLSAAMACTASMEIAKAFEQHQTREEKLRAYISDEIARKPETVERVGSRRARLVHISTFGRRGAVEWLQKQERPKKYLDCRKNQRRGRRKR